jgi:hypothetical protein
MSVKKFFLEGSSSVINIATFLPFLSNLEFILKSHVATYPLDELNKNNSDLVG